MSLPGRFLSRRCFTLCITVEIEPRIAKQHKWHHCCSCKNYQGKGMEGGNGTTVAVAKITRERGRRVETAPLLQLQKLPGKGDGGWKWHHCCSCKNYHGKGMEGGKKVSLHRFLADQKITSSWKKCVLGHPIA